MKTFHEALISHTAAALDLTEDSAISAALRILHGLERGWRVHAELIRTFPEYRDFALGKGVTRMGEELFGKMLAVLRREALEATAVAVMGSLLRIFVELRMAREPQSPDDACNLLDEPSVLRGSLQKLGAALPGLRGGSGARLVFRELIQAAFSVPGDRVTFEEHARVFLEKKSEKRREPNDAPPAAQFDALDGIECPASESSNTDAGANLGGAGSAGGERDFRLVDPSVVLAAVDMVIALRREERGQSALDTSEYFFFRIRRYCELDSEVTQVLCQEGLLSKLLASGPELLFTQESPELVRFVRILSLSAMTRRELRSLFLAFAQPDQSLVTGQGDSMCLRQSLQVLQELSKDVSKPSEPTSWLQIPFAFQRRNSIVPPTSSQERSPTSEVAHDAWVDSALEFNFPHHDVLRIDRHESNFSFVAWVNFGRQKSSPKKRKRRHIASFGSRELLFELWTSGHSVHTRLTCHGKGLGQAVFGVPPSEGSGASWNLLVVNCGVQKKSGGLTYQVDIGFNLSWSKPLLVKPAKGASQGEDKMQMLLLGHKEAWPELGRRNATDPDCVLLSSLHIFHGGRVSEAEAEALLYLGPQPKLISRLMPDQAKLDFCDRAVFDRFPEKRLSCQPVSSRKTHLQALGERACLSFLAPEPKMIFVRVPKGSWSLGGSGGLFQALLPSPSSDKNKVALENYTPVKAITMCPGMDCRKRMDFGSLVVAEGGCKALMLLVARMVELGASEASLGVALDILLTTVQGSEELLLEFDSSFQLLERILDDEHCSLGLSSVKTLLDHCCSRPLLDYGPSRDHYTFAEVDSRPIAIVNSRMVELLFCRWASLKRTTLSAAHQRQLGGARTALELALNAGMVLLAQEHQTALRNRYYC